MKLGIFGGSFDPPHLGHLILAAEARFQLGLERVLWVLTPNPPHKTDRELTPLDIRLAMVKAAIDEETEFELSRVDIDRSPPHFALDTIELLKALQPMAEFTYIIGGDSLHDLPKWHEPLRVIEAVEAIGVMRRPGDLIDLCELEEQLPGISAKIRWVDAPLLEISSSEIRERASQGAPVEYYLPPRVFNIIRYQKLYGYQG